MKKSFFDYSNYRDFLKERYHYLKDTKPVFSARFFAKKAGIRSPSYFRMVVNGERILSREIAIKFAHGLDLSGIEKKALLLKVEEEQSGNEERRKEILSEIEKLKTQANLRTETMAPNHMEILADLRNVKLYMLVQSDKFKLSIPWIKRQFGKHLSEDEIEKRIALMFSSGLWATYNGKTTAVAPILASGDNIGNEYLKKSHVGYLQAAQDALYTQTNQERIVTSRTILFNKKRLNDLLKRINEFKHDIELDFAANDSTDVYDLHISFFEILPTEDVHSATN